MQKLQAPGGWTDLTPAVQWRVANGQEDWEANQRRFRNSVPDRPPSTADPDAASAARKAAALPAIQVACDTIRDTLCAAMKDSVAPDGGMRTQTLATSRRRAPWWSRKLDKLRRVVRSCERRLSATAGRASGLRPPLPPPVQAELDRRGRQAQASDVSAAEWPGYAGRHDLVGLRVHVLQPPAESARGVAGRRIQEGTIASAPTMFPGRRALACTCRMPADAAIGAAARTIRLPLGQVRASIRRARARELQLPLPARLRPSPTPALAAARRDLRVARHRFRHAYELHKFRWSNAKVREAETHDNTNHARNFWRTLDSLFTDRASRDDTCMVMEDAHGVQTTDLHAGVEGAVAQARQVADGAPSVPGETNYDTPAFERTVGAEYNRIQASSATDSSMGATPSTGPWPTPSP